MALAQLVGVRRVILGEVSVQRPNGERERRESARRAEQTQGGEGERRTDSSAADLVLLHSGCAQKTYMTKMDR